MVRTDLDGLPVEEKTGLPYASKARTKDETGKEVYMHACGHDVHMTVFTGVAQTLMQFKNNWKGTIVLIGQPAEERSGGAIAMLKEGLYKNFPVLIMPGLTCEFIFACRESRLYRRWYYGQCRCRRYYHQRRRRPWSYSTKHQRPYCDCCTDCAGSANHCKPGNFPFGAGSGNSRFYSGGTQYNIIPDEVKLQLTLRSYSDAVRNQTLPPLNASPKELPKQPEYPQDRLPIVQVRDQYTPSNYNDIPLTRRLKKCLFQPWKGECSRNTSLYGRRRFFQI